MTANTARADLFRLISGFQISQALYVAATLGLADLLRAAPRTAAELAVATDAEPGVLYRMMRALAAVGVFREDEGGIFALTAMGEFLRDDVTGTHAPMARLFGRPNNWQAWGDLLHSVRSGATAFEHVHGCDVWEYREKRPEETRVFDRAMAAGTERYADAVLEVCDFGCVRHVVDIGGGDGMFLAKILSANPSIRGTLFDQPHVTARALASLHAVGVLDRCATQGGDFFAAVPEGGDAYLLKWILHDWDDTGSIAILRSIRRAMPPASRLIVVEHVLGPPNTGPEGKFLDLMMLVMTGGRERTCEEFVALFARAGFKLISVTPTASPLSLLEGRIEQDSNLVDRAMAIDMPRNSGKVMNSAGRRIHSMSDLLVVCLWSAAGLTLCALSFAFGLGCEATHLLGLTG